MIIYSHVLYERLAPYLSVFERRVPYREPDGTVEEGEAWDVALFGLGRHGAALAASLRERGCRVLAVDFDPETVKQHASEGYAVHYGDAEDPELVRSLPLARTRWVVSTVRDPGINRALVHGLRQENYRGKVAVATSRRADAPLFERDGVDLVPIPYADAAKEAAHRLMADISRA